MGALARFFGGSDSTSTNCHSTSATHTSCKLSNDESLPLSGEPPQSHCSTPRGVDAFFDFDLLDDATSPTLEVDPSVVEEVNARDLKEASFQALDTSLADLEADRQDLLSLDAHLTALTDRAFQR